MGTFKLNLKLAMRFDKCAEIAERMKNFSIPFSNIINEWADGNVQKFEAARGAELTGASGGDLRPATWEPLQSLPYAREKRRKGFADWLMVRTGNLMDSLTNRGEFAEFISDHQTAFGVPYDEEAQAASRGNRFTRPTVFLSGPDRQMIKRNLQQYISMGEGYSSFIWARAGKLGKIQDEAYEMDLNFAEAAS